LLFVVLKNYLDLVATIVQGGIFMGNVNHGKRFPYDFLKSVSKVVKAKLKLYLKLDMVQTGFKPPVRIVTDKDAYKHRTRQIIALITVFPQALFIKCM
jgi:hypothetical protein